MNSLWKYYSILWVSQLIFMDKQWILAVSTHPWEFSIIFPNFLQYTVTGLGPGVILSIDHERFWSIGTLYSVPRNLGFIYSCLPTTGFLPSRLNIPTSHILALITPLICALTEANTNRTINLSIPQHSLSLISSAHHCTLLGKWCAYVPHWRDWDFFLLLIFANSTEGYFKASAHT